MRNLDGFKGLYQCGWAVATLAMFWVHPVLMFPTWMLIYLFDQHDWKLFDIHWQSWKNCLIPICLYVPSHLLLFGIKQ